MCITQNVYVFEHTFKNAVKYINQIKWIHLIFLPSFPGKRDNIYDCFVLYTAEFKQIKKKEKTNL